MFDPGDKKGIRPGGSLLSVRAYQPSAGRRGVATGEATARRAGNDSTPLGGTIFSSRTLKSAAVQPRRTVRDEVSDDAPPAAPAYANDPDPDEWKPLIDPARMLSAIWRARYFIAMMTIAGGVLGAAFALSIPKLYYSTAELQVDPRSLKLVDREITSSDLPFDATLAVVESQMRIMISRTVLNDVIDKLDLDTDPEFNGTQPPRGVIGFALDLLSIGADISPAELRTHALETLWSRLNIARDEKSFIVTVTAGSEDPQKAADIANAITGAYIDFREKMQAGTANMASGELSSRLGELGDKVRESERTVEDFKAENDLIDAQGRLIGDEELLRLNDQLAGARASTIALNARAASASKLTAEDVLLGALPEQVNSSILADLRSQYAGLKQQHDALAIKLGPRHPDLQILTAQIDSAREGIAAEVRRINAAIQIDLKRAVQTEQDLAARLAQVKARQSASKGDLVRLRELERQAAADRAVYEAYLLRARETGEQGNINTANITVISEAQPPLDPIGTSRKLVAAAGLIAGFLAGVAMSVLFDVVQSLRGRGPRPVAPSPSPEMPPTGGGHQWYRRRNPDAAAPYPEHETAPSPDRFGGRFARALAGTRAAMETAPDDNESGEQAQSAQPTQPAAATAPSAPPQPLAMPQAPQMPAPPPYHGMPPYYPAAYAPPPFYAAPPMAMPVPQPVFVQAPQPYPYPYPQPAPAAQPAAAPQPAPPVDTPASDDDRRFEQLRAELGDMRRTVADIARTRRRRA